MRNTPLDVMNFGSSEREIAQNQRTFKDGLEKIRKRVALKGLNDVDYTKKFILNFLKAGGMKDALAEDFLHFWGKYIHQGGIPEALKCHFLEKLKEKKSGWMIFGNAYENDSLSFVIKNNQLFITQTFSLQRLDHFCKNDEHAVLEQQGGLLDATVTYQVRKLGGEWHVDVPNLDLDVKNAEAAKLLDIDKPSILQELKSFLKGLIFGMYDDHHIFQLEAQDEVARLPEGQVR